jgi:RNA polymerase sigma-70 factor (ECF subfamily)
MDPSEPQPEIQAEQLARSLYRAHGPALEHWANQRFSDRQQAQEVVQETVLAAWRNFAQYDPGRGGERAWIFGIARNVAASSHRRSLRHLRTVPTEPTPEAGSDDGELARLADRSLVAEALLALSHDHRAVVVAAYWDGLSTREIAERLGIPDGTVKSRLFYALRSLRLGLEERSVLG